MLAVISLNDNINSEEVINLYTACKWSSAEKPKELLAALRNSHNMVTARIEGRLVGIGNAISDGYLVVYFPHLLVHPDFRRRGLGRKMMTALLDRYHGFHQQVLIAHGNAVKFYNSLGFLHAGTTVPMWIYTGNDTSD